jgi:hypothetical protein
VLAEHQRCIYHAHVITHIVLLTVPPVAVLTMLTASTVLQVRCHPWFTEHLPRYLAVMQADTAVTSPRLDEEMIHEVRTYDHLLCFVECLEYVSCQLYGDCLCVCLGVTYTCFTSTLCAFGSRITVTCWLCTIERADLCVLLRCAT